MMETLFENLTSGSMVFLIRQTLIYAVPLMVVALAGVYAERSGVINLALEGIMIFGAFIGVLFVRLVQQWGWFDAAKRGRLGEPAGVHADDHGGCSVARRNLFAPAGVCGH